LRRPRTMLISRHATRSSRSTIRSRDGSNIRISSFLSLPPRHSRGVRRCSASIMLKSWRSSESRARNSRVSARPGSSNTDGLVSDGGAMSRLPLEGIRVADFSWIINGPQIAQWLATMGAEVIKIESQVYIDISRVNVAGFADRKAGSMNRNGFYHMLNYGKKAINLNLATRRGYALACEIVKK